MSLQYLVDKKDVCSSKAAGFIYAAKSPAFPGLIKIGRALNVSNRLSQLNTACAPLPFVIVTVSPTLDYKRDEKKAHEFFSDARREGEFFDVTESQVTWFFQKIKDCYDCESQQMPLHLPTADKASPNKANSQDLPRGIEEETCIKLKDEYSNVSGNMNKNSLALHEKAMAARRERQIRNRKKRDPTKRAHVPALSNPVVLGLLEEMNHFFESKFEATKEWRNHVYTKDILKLFMSSRDGKETSPLEQNMFLRHCQTVIKTVFPDARYTKHKCHRAYVYIRPIPEK